MAFDNLNDQQLLLYVDGERSRYHLCDEGALQAAIKELIRRGVYPKETVPGNPNDVYTMVRGYGAFWHTWKGTLECPHCKVDLRNHETGPPFMRTVGIYSRALDCTTHYECPDCKQEIKR